MTDAATPSTPTGAAAPTSATPPAGVATTPSGAATPTGAERGPDAPTDDLTPTGSASEALVKAGPRTPDDEGVPFLDAVADERRTAVVTGASSGIGAATARLLADHGFRVICAARRGDRVDALAKEIGGLALTCDVTSEADVARLAHTAGDRVHVLVNNAGGALGLEPVAQADVDNWQQMYDSNVLGTLRVTKALLPALVAADGEGVVVNVGSVAGFTAYEGGGGYTAAKHGVHVLTETLRLELFDQPVRVTLVAPGMVRTEEFSLTRFGGDRERTDKVYEGVPGPLVAEDVAAAIVWMATRPAHVNVDLLVLKPRAQAAAHKVHRT